MKIKRFNQMDLSRDIAEDLLPKLQLRRSKGEKITAEDFESFMYKNGGDLSMTDEVMSELVNMGFNFDTESDSDDCDTCE